MSFTVEHDALPCSAVIVVDLPCWLLAPSILVLTSDMMVSDGGLLTVTHGHDHARSRLLCIHIPANSHKHNIEALSSFHLFSKQSLE